MSPEVMASFSRALAARFPTPPLAALEIGASSVPLLSLPVFAEARRVALNLSFANPSEALRRCEMAVGNSNRLDFADGEFDCVMSCSVLEHDKWFWKSVAETHRVLRPGGVCVVGVPAYMTLPTDWKNTTLTFRRHGLAYDADYYRFSEQAVREVLMEPFAEVELEVVRRYPNPYVVAAGVKR
jgi:SAM-dependent methyltransferase